MERLDTYLANPEWINLYQEASVSHLVRIHRIAVQLNSSFTKESPKIIASLD